MANNPNVNKVIYGNTTVMDISDTMATEGDVVSGKTFYKASGARATGTAVIPDISNCYETTDTAESTIDDADYFPFYDSSASAKRKTLWSNIISKINALFVSAVSLSMSGMKIQQSPAIQKLSVTKNGTTTYTTLSGIRYIEQGPINTSSFVFNDSELDDNAVIEVFTDTWSDNPTSVTVNASNHTCTVVFASSKIRTVGINIKLNYVYSS